jgi:hypothetical protein
MADNLAGGVFPVPQGAVKLAVSGSYPDPTTYQAFMYPTWMCAVGIAQHPSCIVGNFSVPAPTAHETVLLIWRPAP